MLHDKTCYRYYQIMPNIQLLVRPNPGGLGDHRKFITEQAKNFMTESSFTDLVLTSEDGHQVQCHLSLIGIYIITSFGLILQC